MNRVKLMGITVVGICAAFVVATNYMAPKVVSVPDEATPIVSNDRLIASYSPRIGSDMAKVKVVEFLDPECESCAALYPVVKGLTQEFSQDVQLVVRYMLFHSNSKLAALATEAAGRQEKYWEMQQILFTRNEWTHQKEPQTQKFESYATELGLDLEKFRADMKDSGLLANIEKDFSEGREIGVKGTPTFFVNGKMVQSLSYQDMRAAIIQARDSAK